MIATVSASASAVAEPPSRRFAPHSRADDETEE